MMMAAVAFTSCSNDATVLGESVIEQKQSQEFTFRMTGADLNVTQTRAALTADSRALTDLYVLDYDKQTGTLLQVLHQQSTDPKFAEPSLTLAYGQHTIRFVATRSTGSMLTTADGTEFVTTPGTVQAIGASVPTLYTASKISDTFAAEVDVTAGAGSAGSATVTLNRAASRLSIQVKDVVPTGAKWVSIDIATAYPTLPLTTLVPTTTAAQHTDIDVSSVVGKKDQTLAVFMLAPTTAWTSDVTITTKRTDNSEISSFTLEGVSFLRNRTTIVSGEIFQRSSPLTLNVNDAWEDDEVVNF